MLVWCCRFSTGIGFSQRNKSISFQAAFWTFSSQWYPLVWYWSFMFPTIWELILKYPIFSGNLISTANCVHCSHSRADSALPPASCCFIGLAYYSTLKMETIYSSETSGIFRNCNSKGLTFLGPEFFSILIEIYSYQAQEQFWISPRCFQALCVQFDNV